MYRRRIFSPSPAQRTVRTLAWTFGVLGGVLFLFVGLPTQLIGSTQRHQVWSAGSAEVLVVDGETLMLGDRPLRLYGLDAPGRGETCRDGERSYDCGNAAASALASLVAERGVDCRLHGRDRHGRALGVCKAGGVELNASMVAAGWALADAGVAPALAPIEAAARHSARGLWAGGFEPPAHWRRGLN